MTNSSSPVGTAEVQLLGTPVRVWVRSSERYQELLREFTLLQFGHAGGQEVPRRLLTLSEQLTGRYAELVASNNARRDAAFVAGEEQIDLTYEVPVQVRETCATLIRLLEEADEYCRSDQLLTLATPPTQVAFRQWFLGQFITQIDGMAPQPWDGPLTCADDESLPPRG